MQLEVEGCETEPTEVEQTNECETPTEDNDDKLDLQQQNETDETSNVSDDKEELEILNISDIISALDTCQGNDKQKVGEPIKKDTEESQPLKEDKKKPFILIKESNIYLFAVLVVLLAIGIFLMFSSGQKITEPDPIFICPNKEMAKYIDIQHLHTTITAKNKHHHINTTFYWDVTQDETECDSLLSYGEFTDTLMLGWDWDCSPHNMTMKLDMEAKVNGKIYNKTCNINVIFYESPVFGIDLGTTYSCIAFQKSTKNIDNRRETKIVVVDKILNRYCIPSAVYFDTNNKIEFGVEALDKLQSDGLNVVYDIKRIIGRDKDDEEIEKFKRNHLFKIDDDHKSVFVPNINETVLFEQILSLILGYLVETASVEWFRNENQVSYIRDVVVSVPALFHNGQRKAIRSSCHLAGLNPIKLVIEPSAGSLAHSYYNKIPTNKLKFFLSFDFGGGTLDCSIMRCTGVQCNVLSVHGNNQLGGVDFDHVIRDMIIEKFKKQYGLTKISNNMYSKIVKISEEVKIDLTHLIEYELILENDDGEVKSVTITRAEFEQHPKTKTLIQLTIDSVNDAIGTKQGNIRMILMIGGSSKIPIIQESLRDIFGDILVFPDIDAQLMVVTGCGIVGGALAFNNGKAQDKYKDVVLTDVIPLSLGFETCVADTEDKDGDGDNIDCGVMKIILPKDSPFGMKQKPISVCQVMADDTTLDLELYEGGHHYVKDNHFLGKITIEDIKPRQVETCDNVQFSFVVDENGIATVEATTNEKYGQVKRYKIITHVENAEHGSIQNVMKLKQEMISWYPKSFTLLKKALKE